MGYPAGNLLLKDSELKKNFFNFKLKKPYRSLSSM